MKTNWKEQPWMMASKMSLLYIFFGFVHLTWLMIRFFIIKNSYNFTSVGTDLQLSTRSLVWPNSSHKLYDHCRLLYGGLSASQLQFFSITPCSTISLVYDSHNFLSCLLTEHIPQSRSGWMDLRFCPTQSCTTFCFFLPTSFTSQALLFPTRRNLKPKSMGKQQSNSSAKNWGCCQALPQAPYAVTNYMGKLDLTARGASHASCFIFRLLLLVFFHLKQPPPKPPTNSNPTHLWRPRWGSTSSRKPPLPSPQHTKQVLYLQYAP